MTNLGESMRADSEPEQLKYQIFPSLEEAISSLKSVYLEKVLCLPYFVHASTKASLRVLNTSARKVARIDHKDIKASVNLEHI